MSQNLQKKQQLLHDSSFKILIFVIFYKTNYSLSPLLNKLFFVIFDKTNYSMSPFIKYDISEYLTKLIEQFVNF